MKTPVSASDGDWAARCVELERKNRSLRRTLERRERALAQACAELDACTQRIAHEFRTPLYSINGFTDELLRLRDEMFALPPGAVAEQLRVRGELDEALHLLDGASTQMRRLIDSTLGVLRAGKGALTLVRVDVDALVRQLVTPHPIALLARQGTLLIGPLPSWISDAAVLRDVFARLLENAVENLRDDAAFHIEITGEVLGDTVMFHVHDNGRGLDDHERAFQTFGGLAHVRAALRRLGGTLIVQSELGAGSSFSFELPRHERALDA